MVELNGRSQRNETPRLSAHSLRQYALCPRKFALRYKENRFWPAADPAMGSDGQIKAKQGQAFHRLVERRALGMDTALLLERLEQETPGLRALWEAFEANHPVVPEGARLWTEQSLHFTVEGIPCTVRFDRLVKHGDRWIIYDWKTGRLSASLLDDWQSRLYPYALVEAGQSLASEAIAPEQVSLVYWEVATGRPLELSYDAGRHRAVGQELAEMARRVSEPFLSEMPDDPRFPRRSEHCPSCVFASLCNQTATLPEPRPAELPLPRFL